MSQKSLHDFFKVRGPSPRVQKIKSPKSPVIRVRKLTTMLAQVCEKYIIVAFMNMYYIRR